MLRIKPVKKCFFFPLFPFTSLLKQHHQAAQCRNSANPTPRFFTFSVFFINLGTDPPRSGVFEFLDLRKMKSGTTFYKTDILWPNLRHWQQMSSSGEELQFPNFFCGRKYSSSQKKTFVWTMWTLLERKISSTFLQNFWSICFVFFPKQSNFTSFFSKHRLQSNNTLQTNRKPLKGNFTASFGLSLVRRSKNFPMPSSLFFLNIPRLEYISKWEKIPNFARKIPL